MLTVLSLYFVSIRLSLLLFKSGNNDIRTNLHFLGEYLFFNIEQTDHMCEHKLQSIAHVLKKMLQILFWGQTPNKLNYTLDYVYNGMDK